MTEYSAEALAESIARRDALDASIADAYETDDEREAARSALADSEGIDWKTGWPADYEAPEKPPEEQPGANEAAALSEDAAVGNQEVKAPGKEPGEAGKTEAGGETGDETGDEDEAAKAAAAKEAAEKAEADAAAAKEAEDAALKAEVETLRRQNADLQSKAALAEADADIRKEVAEAVKEKRTAHDSMIEEETQRVAKFTEDYGEDAAKVLQEQVEESRKLREKEIEDFQNAAIAKARAEKEQEIDSQSALQRDIDAVPEFRDWRNDALAAWNGNTEKSGDHYNLAVSIDTALRDSPQWDGRPRQERFAKVVEMVNASMGADSRGAPGAQETGKETPKETPPAKAKETPPAQPSKEDIAAEIAKKAAEAARNKNDDLPDSMSHIPGGAAGAQTELAKIENMSAAELADHFGDSPDALARMDAFFDKHLSAAEAQAGAN